MINYIMLILKHAELFTKSEQVRKRFLRKLVRNIKSALPDAKVNNRRMRIFVYAGNEEKAVEILRRVFGISSVAIGTEMRFDMEAVKRKALEISKAWDGSFAVKSQRLTKDIDMTSQQISSSIGAFIKKHRGLEVDLKNPKHVLFVEYFEGNAYLYTRTFQAVSGLPLSTAGKIIVENSDPYSLLSAWLMMRRGASIILRGSKDFLRYWDYGAEVEELAEIGDQEIQRADGIARPYISESSFVNGLPVFYPLAALDKKTCNKLLSFISKGELPPSFDLLL
ncbi:hypothetical protein DRN74_03350 [Candidatus Micrarchaeota archaeon]|nr:MAG: hypothetical protein DRN74_03350 [Candidatus Micrarchaeota archaeon]